MSIDQLVFVGLNGWAIALDRDSGNVVWSNDQMKSGDVTMLLDGDRLIVSTNGYLYCLDPLSGRILWEQPLRGYRTGIAALCSARGKSDDSTVAQQHAADARRRRAASDSSSQSHA